MQQFLNSLVLRFIIKMNTLTNKNINIEELAENHTATSIETPLRPDAFDLTNEEKIERVKKSFSDIMETLGLDLTDDSLKGTPNRVAKLFVNELNFYLVLVKSSFEKVPVTNDLLQMLLPYLDRYFVKIDQVE